MIQMMAKISHHELIFGITLSLSRSDGTNLVESDSTLSTGLCILDQNSKYRSERERERETWETCQLSDRVECFSFF